MHDTTGYCDRIMGIAFTRLDSKYRVLNQSHPVQCADKQATQAATFCFGVMVAFLSKLMMYWASTDNFFCTNDFSFGGRRKISGKQDIS